MVCIRLICKALSQFKYLEIQTSHDGQLTQLTLVEEKGTRDITSLIEQILYLYSFTGTESLEVEGSTVDEAYNLIYDLPLPSDVRLVYSRRCECKAQCSKVVPRAVDKECRTFGNLFSKWGKLKYTASGAIWYSCVDTRSLYVSQLISPPIINEKQLAHNKTYIQWTTS